MVSQKKKTDGVDIRALRVFEAVATSGNLSVAAQQLGITQSAVSQTLNQIEQMLEVLLFDRTRRPLKLTAAGIALSRRARQIVDDMDRLVVHVREADLMIKPALRVGMIDSFAATVGPTVVRQMTSSASQLLLWSGLANSHATAFLNRQLDVIVSSDPLDDVDAIIRRVIFAEPFLVVIPKNRKSQFENKSLRELMGGFPLIRFSSRSHFGVIIDRYLRRRGLIPQSYLEIDTADVVMAMVAADLGWTITTPLCLLQGKSHLKDISVLPYADLKLKRTIYQLSREGEFEEMALLCSQVSKQVLHEELVPLIRSYIPWLEESEFVS